MDQDRHAHRGPSLSHTFLMLLLLERTLDRDFPAYFFYHKTAIVLQKGVKGSGGSGERYV